MYMTTLDTLKQLPYWNGIPAHALNKLCDAAEIITVDEGVTITEQFQSASDFYLLIEGSIDHYVTLLNQAKQSFQVGSLNKTWSALGWSGFIEPHRYSTEIRCATPATLVQWNYDALHNLIESYPEIYHALLKVITETSQSLIQGSRELLSPFPASEYRSSKIATLYPEEYKQKADPEWSVKFLKEQEIFNDMTLAGLQYISDHSWIQHYTKGKNVFLENQQASDLMILVNGTINLYYTNNSDDTENPNSTNVFMRSLSQPGQVVSWSSLAQSQGHDYIAVAEKDVAICCIPSSIITQLCITHTSFAINLFKILLKDTSNQLLASRALLIRQHTQNEQSAVSSLLHNLGPKISIESPLNKIPYLLKNRATQEDAFSYLQQARQQGCLFEKNVAGLCSDLLVETRREFDFYKGLHSIYQMVINADKTEEPRSIRNKSAKKFFDIFSKTRHLIMGEQNLPDTSGHIFILNHLVSHPYHKLPNGFEFSLDTHFISAMILNEKYGDSGVRVVRKSRYSEYGHEAYYQRLGHINVYTNESRPSDSNEQSTNWRDRFYADATRHLQRGDNIIICPEGTSNWSDNSPSAFKSGAFRLAAMQDRETLIVPIVVANFDKLLSETVLAAIVKPPIKVADAIDFNNPQGMSDFLVKLRADYKNDLQQTQSLANEIIAKL